MTSPLDRYRQNLADRTATQKRWSTTEFRISILRLAVMILIFAFAWMAVQRQSFSLIWVAVPVITFLALITVHERVLRKKRRAEQACQFFQSGIDRIEERWREAPSDDGSRFVSADHLYAADLDVLGSGSLYHLLNQTRTRAGEETLAQWLLTPAHVDEVKARQPAVAELMDRGELREEMATLGSEVRSELDPDRLAAWATGEPILRGVARLRWALALAALSNLTCSSLWLAGLTTGRPLGLSLVVSFALFLILRQRIAKVVQGVEQTGRDLQVIAELMDRLERETFDAPWLIARSEELTLDGARPGEEIHKLQKWVERLESRRNAFFAPFGALLLWTSQIAFVVEDWRARWGTRVARWLAVVGELEAAACLGTFAYERGLNIGEDQGVVFPVILDLANTRFEATALGHPLIAPVDCIRNDIALAVGDRDRPQALVISGSNMSGKSTFLRACGLNMVLAWAGAPVVARSMNTTPLSVGASIRIQDSLQEGSSKFYAEIKRLRSVLDLARAELPALCLLDEILHGTNSHDRRIGAAAVVKALLQEEAVVMVTTHDLVLARLTEEDDFDTGSGVSGADVSGPEAAEPAQRRLDNVHFIDTIEDGRIHFDYHLRQGVVTKSNALELMREVGLEV